MKNKLTVFVLMALFVCSMAICGAETVLSEKEKEKIALISKVKKLEATLGLLPTSNFKEYREALTNYNLFFYSKKTDVPFSYIDPLLNYQNSDYNNLASSVAGYNIDLKDYDAYFYTTLGIASGTFITKNLLKSEDVVIAEVVFHEDMHDNTNLPRHIDEATALVVGIAGSSLFVKMDEGDFHCLVNYINDSAVGLKSLHRNITELNLSYRSGRRSLESYLTIRDLKLRIMSQESMASVAQNHTYLCYVPILLRLFEAMNYDLKKFIAFMKAFPFKEPSWDLGHEAYFKETLRVEEEATLYLEKSIAELGGGEQKKVPLFSFSLQGRLISNMNMVYLMSSINRMRHITKFREFRSFNK